MSNKASVSGEEKESLAGEEHVPQSVNGVLGSGDTSAGQAEISASDIADLSTVVISHQLQLPLLISPPRRRSMTVPLEVALFPTAPACGAGPGDPEPPPDPSSSSSTSAASAPTTLPPRKPNRFVVSKISEQTLKDGGSALILPAQRSSANSSLAGSPEVGRARSPLVYSEGQMVSPSMDGALPTIIPSKSRTSSFSRGASLSRGASKDHPDLMDSPVLPEPSPPEHEPFVFLGVCAMAKKAKSKYMTEILTRITQEFEQIKTIVFDEQQILNDPVEKWPIVDALISFQSERFPLERAVQYAKLRNPFLVNDLEMQFVIKDRRKVYELLKSEGIDLPRYGVLDRDSGKPEDARIEEFDDYVVVNGATFNKPFVEKPICADDHNVYIYYPMSAGGGSQRLFRKIGSRSSVYSNESKVRKTGSFIYEEFMPTDGTDVKVYTVGLEYAHAEARKSPALDGVVERDKEGKEIRFPVILNNIEKLIARRVCLAFKQTVCGFDLLRTNGRSYVCDVNGFSFVKNSMIYYNDCAKIVANNILRRLAPELHIPWAMPYQLEDPPIVTTTQGKMMELRCVVAIIRHGDRTPKQKMKMEMRHAMFFAVFTKFGGKLDADGREIKLKKPDQLQEILDIVRQLLAHHLHEAEVKEKRAKLEQLKSVLEMYGHFSGINRKIQIKYQPLERADTPERNQASSPITETQEVDPMLPAGNLVLIMKWGGELTPLGKYQSEQLGQMFRCMYPGSGEFSRKKGHGLLRLHSTFRHDLKIYASDEGRVQTTAAAFAKGLLALEGELTPILVQMVKSADTNGLLDNDVDARESENTTAFYLKSEHFELAKFFHSVKKRLKSILKQDRDFVAADYEILNPTNSVSVKIAMDVIKNPVKACEAMCDNIRDLNVAINEKASNKEIELPTLYSGESWDLLQRRWGKLEKDFRLRDGNFDITKIPDIYDCIKFDMHHNQWINRFTCAKKLFALARNLANIVVPMEYGINSKEKLAIAQGVATPLLRKIRGDLQHVVDYLDDPENTNRLDPRFSQNVASPGRLVRSRLYFTSESHIHSLVNILRFGGLIAADDEQWSRAMKYISTVPEFNFLTQIVIMMYEDPNKDHNSDDRFHIELHFSPGMLLRNDDLEPEGPGFLRFGKPSRSNSVSHEAPDSTVTAKASQVTLKNDNTLHEPTGPPRKLSSMSHLAEGWLDNLDANSTINFPKTRYDRSVFRLNESGVVMNRVFSTAVIKGVSSGSSLDKIDDSNDNSDSLETLHNEISFKQLNEFFKRITESSSRQVSAVTSPARTPDASLVTSLSETDDNHNRFWTNPESLAADLLNQEKNMERRFSASNDMITENGHFDVDFSVTNASDDGGMSTPDPLMMDMASLQPPDSGGVDRSISPASSPVIESLLFSPSKDRMEEGDPCEEPMDDLPHRVVRALSFDFEMDGVKD